MEIHRYMNHIEGMELNALYQQDVDLGVNWPLFEPVKNIEEVGRDVGLQQKTGSRFQDFIVDGETGEYLPIRQDGGKQIQSDNETGQGVFNLEEFLSTGIPSEPEEGIQLIHDDNTDTINTELWDDIATLSEAYMALDSGECAKQEMSASPVHESGPFRPNHFPSDVFSNPTQIQMPEQQKPMPKDQFFNAPYPTFPTPPYSDHNDSPTSYNHPANVTFSPDSNKSYSPVNLEDVELAEMMMTQQQNDLLAELDSVANINVSNPNPPPLNAEEVSTPGGWFLDGSEPTTNLSEVLAELDMMNNIPNQAGPYMNPPNAPYVPPPVGTVEAVEQRAHVASESESLDSGYGDHLMDIDLMEITQVDSASALMPIDQNQESAKLKKMKQRESRDEKKARELGISLTMEQIINTPVEEYNELLSRANLNPTQQALIRDIRRRGKNKVAAQNCRKRKIETISTMEVDIDDLHSKRQELLNTQRELESAKKNIQAKYNQLYQQIFNSLRDETGRPYDQSRFSLQQVEGAIILVPGKFSSSTSDKSETKSQVSFFDLSKVKIEKDISI